jgi:hypothetical protein
MRPFTDGHPVRAAWGFVETHISEARCGAPEMWSFVEMTEGGSFVEMTEDGSSSR